ncbi:hypothetical protein GCM10009741_51230 [Kribbella lupini]|uniref:Na+-driven multidrug efflux pump n=1 Tax=Kribbella lupini TaxID=291602 RepID=A0ABN2BL77_9ACTN
MTPVTARMLGGWLGLGAVLTAGTGAGILLKKPFRIDEAGDLGIVYAVLGGWLAVHLVLGALVVADAVRLTRRRELDALRRGADLVKLVAIPFFGLNFVTLTGAVVIQGAGDRDRLGLDGFAVALLFVVLTYLALLPTSAYGVGCLVVMREDEHVGRLFFGVNVTLHFLFVVDVLSSIVVVEVAMRLLGTARAPGAWSRNLMTGVLAAGSSVAAVWLVFVAIFYGLDLRPDFIAEGIFWLALVPPAEFVLLVVVPVVPLVTFRTAVRLFLAGDLETLRRTARTVKLALIPLFLQNVVICTVIVLGLTLLPIAVTRGAILVSGPAGIAFVGVFTATGLVPTVIGTYLMLLPTSIYGVTCLALMMRQRAVSPRYGVVNTLLHLIFVADVVSALATFSGSRPGVSVATR